MRLRIIGTGRAGSSFAAALGDRCEVELFGRGDHRDAGVGVDAVLLCVPDRAIAEVAASIRPTPAAVLHCSGATTLVALAPHARRGSLHPLTSMPDAVTGAQRLRGAWMALSGDPIVAEIAAMLHARTFPVGDGERALYHATAAIAANHLTALMACVERLADRLHVPSGAFYDLARGALDNAAELGAARALTGPVARGDWPTVRDHMAALPQGELDLYRAAIAVTAALAGRELPDDLR